MNGVRSSDFLIKATTMRRLRIRVAMPEDNVYHALNSDKGLRGCEATLRFTKSADTFMILRTTRSR